MAVAVVAGLAVWGFGRLSGEDTPAGADRPPNTVPESTPPTTETSRGANEANVGDCVKVVKGGLDAELEVLECGTPDAIYRVALEPEMGERCPTGPYTEYSMTGLGGWSLCLALDARPGQCFATFVADVGFAATDCAAADVKVEAVLTGTADRTACPPPPPNVAFHPRPLVYPTPPLTICLANVPK